MSAPDRLLLFARIPEPGRVKTRLCPPLRPTQAAELYEAFLKDILAQSLQIGQQRTDSLSVELHYCGGDEADLPDWIRDLEGLTRRPQQGADLGARMAHAFDTAFADGASRVVLRNTDSPTMPALRVSEAFESLRAPGVDLVLGPDLGGGYYLVGLERPLPDLFELPALGSHADGRTVLEASRIWALAEDLSLCMLREEADVDLPADLERLLASDKSVLERAPHTSRVLDRIRT